ncbi:ABC transporter [Salipiger pallidus]|uniref:ABC transporter n=1 Tax=Salipiger pallidus TaxID=1775170 RepID=A0A8J2ZIW3_9RHOB|nr:PotD/PotF family extracellular solute-binding protein [Salipiger pallidus]GGG68625.1 ABC transporter [Salipiger pallidus]
MSKFTKTGAITRRSMLKGSGTLALAGAMSALPSPFIRNAEAATLEIRALMWEPYVLPAMIAEFEAEHGVKFTTTFFDGNSEAYNKLKLGGTRDFDLAQADGFWSRLYSREGLIRDIDLSKISSMDNVFPAFTAPEYELLTEETSGAAIGVPFCWGGYGITYNADEVSEEEVSSLGVLFDAEKAGHLSASARFEENIALAAILVTARMGTQGDPRPDGKPFNPYVLTDAELDGVQALLIEQKGLLMTRYQDLGTLNNLMRSGIVWAAPEFSQVFRQLQQLKREGKRVPNIQHRLQAEEGGLGWIDSWMVTSGVEDSEKLEVCHRYLDTILRPEHMKAIADKAGTSTCVDIRDLSTEEERELFLMDRTAELKGLHMFDQPSSPEKWERVWSNMEAA